MYKVIADFFDMQDNNYAYKVGDTFPHDGVSVSDKRIEILSSKNNRRKMPLIQKIEEAKPVIVEEVETIMPAPVDVVEDAVPVVDEVVKKPRRSRKK